MSTSTPDYSNYFWQGEKVRLRPWRLDDVELRFLTSLDSPSVALHQDGIELPTSIEFWQKWLEKVVSGENDKMIRFVIETLEGVSVGWINIHSRDQKNGTFGFGLAVYREHRGNGYAVDATRLILKYGFWEQRYQKCNSMCLHTNSASIRLHVGPHQPELLQENEVREYDVKANWKIFVENYIDVYHLSHLHSETLNMYDHTKLVSAISGAGHVT